MRKIENIGDVEAFPVDVIIKKPVAENMRVLSKNILRYVIGAEKLRVEDIDIVVDASCGEGQGTYYLSTLAKKTYGLDISKENLMYANKYFKGENIRFLSYFDFLKSKVTGTNKLFCIETLEHIEQEKMDRFTKILYRILKVGGDMFLTVPIGKNKPSEYNPFHPNEPSIEVVYNTFMPHFKRMEIVIDSFINSYHEKSEFALISLYGKKGWYRK